MKLLARREAKTRIRHRDWLKLAREKIRREQVGTVPTFLFVRANKLSRQVENELYYEFGRNVEKFFCLLEAIEEPINLLMFEDAATLQLGYLGLLY